MQEEDKRSERLAAILPERKLQQVRSRRDRSSTQLQRK